MWGSRTVLYTVFDHVMPRVEFVIPKSENPDRAPKDMGRQAPKIDRPARSRSRY
jgi:hypothetical protein